MLLPNDKYIVLLLYFVIKIKTNIFKNDCKDRLFYYDFLGVDQYDLYRLFGNHCDHKTDWVFLVDLTMLQ